MRPFAPLKEYLLANRWYIALGFLSVAIVDILQLLIPRIIKSAVDALAGGAASEAPLERYAFMIITIGMGICVFRFLWRYCILGTSRRIEKQLRDKLFGHIILLPLKTLGRMKTGDLMARMTNDLEAVRMCMGIGLVALLDTLFLGMASLAFMLYISPSLTLICTVPLIFIILITWRLSGLLHQRFSKVQAAFAALVEKVRETLSGIWVIKAYVREHDTFLRFSQLSTDYINTNLNLAKIWGLFLPAIMLFSNLSVGVLIFFGGRLTVLSMITAGDFVAFASYLWILTWPMIALGWVVNLFQRGSASMIRINEITDLQQEYAPALVTVPPVLFTGDIEARNLTFSYAYGVRAVLDGVSFSLRPGRTLGITGKTGSGKTTLCHLLLRLYKPPRGTVFVDGVDICTIPHTALRSQIAYVPQDGFLFSDTISENISFGKPETTLQEITRCAEAAQVLNDIAAFSDGFKTLLGEKGITLSGGQKQRLCIARALLLSAPILIVDDALSSLDAATARSVVHYLKTSPHRRTTVIVSNRISSLKHADTILVFDNGRIAESGTHDELLQQRGLYYNLYCRQQLENESVS